MPGWTGPGQYFCRRGLSRSPSYLRLREPLPVPSWREKEQREAVGGFNSQAWNDAHHFCSLSRTRSDDHTSLQRSLAIAVQSHAQKKKKKCFSGQLAGICHRHLLPNSICPQQRLESCSWGQSCLDGERFLSHGLSIRLGNSRASH